ncbi:MAG: type III secretion system cytoplasmic ring protein SctQ [Opitutaceae bacterium]|nr:type III secretion system cytoplasmic ring protein SctQ [Opitutaceae bacterium]
MEPPLMRTGVAALRATPEGEIRRESVLVGIRRVFTFAWAGKPGRLRFTPAAAAPVPSGHLRLKGEAFSCSLGLPALPEPSSLGVAFAGIEVAALPEELLLGVLELWLADPLAALQRQGLPVQLAGWSIGSPERPALCGWEISWDGKDRFLAGTLHAEAAAADHLVRRIEKVPAQLLGTADSLPVPISAVLTRLPLAPATLRTLGVGDVIFVPLAPGDRTQGNYELWSGTRLMGRATRNRQTFRVSTMNPPAEPSAKLAAGAARVDDLPIPVVFDVGQIELTVGQLRSVGEGYTFELPATPPRLVTLRAHGREIGQGELVEIGDKVGVRIVQWNLV